MPDGENIPPFDPAIVVAVVSSPRWLTSSPPFVPPPFVPPPRHPKTKNYQGTSDSFGLVYEELTGDVNATLHLEKMARRTKFTRGGLMIRSGNASDAAHVSILVDPDRGVTMYHRANAGGSTGGKNLGVMTEDVVMRLEKTGDAVRCLYRQIGAAGWIELGTASATFGDTFLVGRAVASGELGAHAQVTTGALIIERRGAGSSVQQ